MKRSPPKIHVKMPWSYRSLLFSLLALSWLTGIAFYGLNRWFMIDGDFGLEKHPWQYPALQLHGLAAFGMLMAYGALVANHIPPAWRIRRLRWAGGLVLVAFSVQIISAYALYYLGNENLRSLTANLHTFNGAALPLFLVAHIVAGINKRRNQQKPYRHG